MSLHAPSIYSSRNHLLALILIVAVSLVAPSVGIDNNAQDIKQAEDDEDVTSVWKQHVVFIQDYLDHPIQHLNKMALIGLEEEEEEDDDDYEEYEPGESSSSKDAAAMDIEQLLDDLEDEFESASNTCEFYNLGGWPLLVSLVSKSAHSNKHNVNGISNSDNDDLVSMEDEILTIRASAALAMGTAVKNREEFHPWVLQEQVVVVEEGDDSTVATTTTPLHLVTQALLEVIDAAQTPGSCSQLTVESQEQLASSAMYALESFLRGNPSAHNAFAAMTVPDNKSADKAIAQVFGSQVLRWVQEAEVAATDTQSSNARMSRHAIGMTDRLLALVNDMVRDVPSQDAKNDDLVTQAFSTNVWCNAAMQAATIQPVSDFKRLVFGHLQRTAIESVFILSSYCPEYFQNDHGKEFVAALARRQQQEHEHQVVLEGKRDQQEPQQIVDSVANEEPSNATQSHLPPVVNQQKVFDLRTRTNSNQQEQAPRMQPDQTVKDS
jgi:hypothetical protein